MGSLEVNKGAAAILVAGIVFLGSGFIGEALIHPEHLKETAVKIQGTAEPAGGGAPEAPPQLTPIAPLLVSADSGRGGADSEKLCVACHSFNQGGAAKIGPNLYGILGAKRAHMAGFNYSEGLQKLGGVWTYEELNHWLYNPREVVPGTRMSFAGIKNDKERADVIAYLRSLSPNPEPLPAVVPAAAAAPATPAGAETPAAQSSGQKGPAGKGVGENQTPTERSSGTTQPTLEPQTAPAGTPAPAAGNP